MRTRRALRMHHLLHCGRDQHAHSANAGCATDSPVEALHRTEGYRVDNSKYAITSASSPTAGWD